MEMKLKPAKCRSFSIRSGVPSRINFTIGETEIPNIFQEEQKFLGNLLYPTGKLSHAFDYIKSEFETKLININALLIQDEYRVGSTNLISFFLFHFCSLFIQYHKAI